MKNSEILSQARALIEKPENWCQGSYARLADGREAFYENRNACSFCSVGAVRRVQKDNELPAGIFYDTYGVKYLLADAMEGHILRFNDSRTHAEVLQAFDKAIEQAKKEESVNENL